MIKKLAQCIGQYKRDTILTPVFVAVEVAMEIIIPLLMANIIDQGIAGGNLGLVTKTGLWLVLVCVVSLFFGIFSGRFAARASSGFARNLRRRMFYQIQEFSFTNIDRFSITSLVTRLTTDVTNVQNSFQMIIRIVVRAPLMILFSVAMVFSINSRLALIFAAVIPVLAIGLILIMTKTTPIFSKVFNPVFMPEVSNL